MSKTRTLAERLNSCRALIFNSRDETIAPLLTAFGADSEFLDKGEALYTEAIAMVEQQAIEYQEQSQAYDMFNSQRDEVRNTYARTNKIVRTFSRYDEDLADRLNVQYGKNMAIEKWFENAIGFYNRVQHEQEFLDSLLKFKVTTERLQEEQQTVRDLKKLRDEALKEKGEAQEATRLRNEKLDALDDYCTDLRMLAELALEEQPQLLEKLGILVRSVY